MKIQPISNNNNKTLSHKAYFKHNANFKKLFGEQAMNLGCEGELLKKFKDLPSHELEILEIVKKDINISNGKILCTIFNNETKKAITLSIKKTCGRFDELMYRLTDINNAVIMKFFLKEHNVINNFDSLTKI